MNHQTMAERLHALDGLRALASMLVLFHHLFPGGVSNFFRLPKESALNAVLVSFTASGVELFFVLSAVVLVRPYFLGRPFVASLYFKRRFLRLMPAYWVALIFAGAVLWLLSERPTWWTESSKLPPFSLIDWFSQAGLVYFGSAAYSFAWWSLTVEVVFYIFVPFIVLMLRQVKSANLSRNLWVLLLVAAAVGQSVQHWSWVGSGDNGVLLVVRHLLAYSSCFAAGLVLARGKLSTRVSILLMIGGLLWLGSVIWFPAASIHVGWSLFYLGFVSLALSPDTGVSRFLSRDLLVWVGERSYSLFLTHYTVIALVCWVCSIFLGGKGVIYYLLTRSFSVVLSLWVAMCLFYFVEKRFAKNLMTGNRFWPVKKNVNAS